MGDDLPDLPILRKCGFSVAVPESVAEVLQETDYVTRRGAGQGAVREVCEIILKAQGLWEQVTARYF
jgi:3-deoxy-D-manno-octulosonate 8-phosphate phosphatase (KDO 8-P phosphatase)